MPENAKNPEKPAADEPKPENPSPATEPKPPQPPALDITDEEWIAASQGCCGRNE